MVAIENTSGHKEMGEYKCLVLADAVEEVSKGGIVLVQETVDKNKYNTNEGILILAGGNAFEDWKGWIPQPGQRISFYPQGAKLLKGKDGQDYRIVNDKDILSLLDE